MQKFALIIMLRLKNTFSQEGLMTLKHRAFSWIFKVADWSERAIKLQD